jgi:hypothetical protein
MESLSADELGIISLMLPFKDFVTFSITSKEYKSILDTDKMWRSKFTRILHKNDFQYCYLKVQLLYYDFLKMYKLNESNLKRIKRLMDLDLIFVGNNLIKSMFKNTFPFFKYYRSFTTFEKKVKIIYLYIYLFEYTIYLANFEPELLYTIMVSSNDNIEHEMHLNLLQELSKLSYELSYYCSLFNNI